LLRNSRLDDVYITIDLEVWCKLLDLEKALSITELKPTHCCSPHLIDVTLNQMREQMIQMSPPLNASLRLSANCVEIFNPGSRGGFLGVLAMEEPKKELVPVNLESNDIRCLIASIVVENDVVSLRPRWIFQSLNDTILN